MGLFNKKSKVEKRQKKFEKRFNHAMEVYRNEGLVACKPLVDKLTKEGCIKATLFIRERLLANITSTTSKEDKESFRNAANNLLRIAADQGDAESQFVVGYMYEFGDFFAKDMTKAVSYYRLAAKENHPKAQNNLGSCYCSAKGVGCDYAVARYWYEKSANQNNPRAFLNLGHLYRHGSGVTKDMSIARDYYFRAISASKELLYKEKEDPVRKCYNDEELDNVIRLANQYLEEC